MWVYLYTAQCRLFLGQIDQAEQELLAGMTLAESIKENRALSLFRPVLAVAQAMQGRLDEALQTASASLQDSSTSLIYSHFEALRCLAEVHFRRNELDEAQRICNEAEELLAPTESRLSRLWLGPLHIQVLLAAQKRDDAKKKLTDYQALVAGCQSPRFTAEASRLATVIESL
jgi:ATP/maltotriose-dependent transcriptional regulator MalT